MLIVSGTEIAGNTLIKNDEGYLVKRVKSFDTETKIAEIYGMVELFDHEDGNRREIAYTIGEGSILDTEHTVPTFKCILHDCKAYDRKTGKELK